MPKKKKFIDKKKSVTFQLIHRSQQDPLLADEDAPQRILQPIQKKKETPEEREKRIEEQHKYGIYYNDDTNYLEFLKERSDNRVEWPSYVDKEIEDRQRRFALPSEVFASAKEKRVGMLNEAGPQLDLDPEIVAALDDDFNFDDPDNQLEDNFIELANGVASDDEQMDVYDEDECTDSSATESGSEYVDDESDCFSVSESCSNEETKTNISSCTIPFKNFEQEKLTKEMDKMLKQIEEISRYRDEHDGPQGCTQEETERHLKWGEEFYKSLQPVPMDRDEDAIAITKNIAKRKNAFKTEFVEYEVKEKPQYDCQSIISTYSRTRHLPTLIELPSKPKKIRVNQKTGMPMNILGQNKLTRSVLEKHNEKLGDISGRGPQSIQSTVSRLTALSIRDKNETPEEKRERKKALKEYRQERRQEKKSNRLAFTAEQQRLSKARNVTKGFTLGSM
ncbi:protein LTV1 homolog [Coccinella septempunctata]|uniref:protein LTV1 homolog n=1 Tax=Coccinella septempunctata TaxID=41139 RepID=UPI001D074563|nr:protein LTV1 homolog [Coccinella septempunctata]